MTILVTGGAGFIGSNFVREWVGLRAEHVVTLDALSYAGHSQNLEGLDERTHTFVKGDIRDGALIRHLLFEHQPRAVIHLAAESHVDRSIKSPTPFISTNIVGTFEVLEAVRDYHEGLRGPSQEDFRFLHISTDEVYGSLGSKEAPLVEVAPYLPSSPYSASKAASDHLVQAYARTYSLPVIIAACTNNYGPRQHPEKLIPLTITAGMSGEKIPVYGDGTNLRDWLHVSDHCAALRVILDRGRIGEKYHISAGNERRNIDVVRGVCELLDEYQPGARVPHAQLITFVEERAGHDVRYALDSNKLRIELGWNPVVDFARGLRETVLWYLRNPDWLQKMRAGQASNDRRR